MSRRMPVQERFLLDDGLGRPTLRHHLSAPVKKRASVGCRSTGVLRHGLLTKHERLSRLEKPTAERKLELTEEPTTILDPPTLSMREARNTLMHCGACATRAKIYAAEQ